MKTTLIPGILLLTFALVIGVLPVGLRAQAPTLEEVLKSNSHTIEVLNGNLSGDGMNFLMKISANAQFFAVAEPHNAREVPEFTTMLFRALHERYGFNYLALEQDPVMAHMVSEKSVVGKRDSVIFLAKKYPNAFTFNSDQELEMIAEAGEVSHGKAERVWGLDQVFGALHILERLKQLAPKAEVRDRVSRLIELVREYEAERFKEGHRFMNPDIPKPDDLKNLLQFYQPKKGSEAEFLITQLLTSVRIYENNYLAGKGQRTGYEANREREENMKTLFMREYRLAQSAGEPMPKVLLKFGHYHIIQERSWSSVLSLGNFVLEFAKSNNMDSVHLAVFMNNASGDYGVLSAGEDYKALASAAPNDKWTIVDLRPLRSYLQAGQVTNVQPEMRRLIFGFDAALLLGGGSRGTFKLTEK